MLRLILLFTLVLANATSVIYNYTILSRKQLYNYDIQQFSKEVTIYLNNGWDLAGNLIVSRSTSAYGVTVFYQPFKKEVIQDNYLDPF